MYKLMKNVCVFAASSSMVPEAYTDAACETGALLAENGLTLIFGAGAVGLMGAAAQGAKAQDGEIIGIIPKLLNQPGIPFLKCSRLIEVEDMPARKNLMIKMSDAYIVLAGGFGTFDELFEVLTLKQLAYINVPIVIVNTEGYYDNLLKQLQVCVSEGFINRRYLSLFTVVDTPSDAIDYILQYKREDFPDKISEAAFKYHTRGMNE